MTDPLPERICPKCGHVETPSLDDLECTECGTLITHEWQPRRERHVPTEREYLISVRDIVIAERDVARGRVSSFAKATQEKQREVDDRAREALRLDRLGYSPHRIGQKLAEAEGRDRPYTAKWAKALINRGHRLENLGTDL